MLGFYILAAMLGGGLLLFSVISGALHGVGDVDATGVDVGGVDADVPHLDVEVGHLDADVSHVDVHVAGADHDVHVSHGMPGQMVLGFFRPRNLIFFLTAFGLTGTLLTVTGGTPDTTLTLSLVMGGGAWLMTYGVFTWLRRSESLMDAVSEVEIEGCPARVVLPLAPGEPGRIACVVADREFYLTARLAPEVSNALEAGSEVVILRFEGGVAEIIPFDTLELPPAES